MKFLSKYIDPENLEKKIAELRSAGKNIGLSHGVFDLLHPGHIQHFIAAKREVDVLFVSITADIFVNKGPGRPIFTEEIRLATLEALEAIDFVTISNNKSALDIISKIKPDIYFKGSDYKNSEDDPTGRIDEESREVVNHGGKVHFTDELTSSSSKLINSFFNSLDLESANWLKKFKEKFSIDEIDKYLESIQELDIAILGEIIIDRYTNVEPLAKSSKDPILAFQLQNTQVFAGGVLAIANNCASWVKSVSIYSTIGVQDESLSHLKSLLNKNIDLNLVELNKPTITKHRYIDSGTDSKVFETYNFDPTQLNSLESEKYIKLISNIKSKDAVLVADYGHGLINSEIINAIIKDSNYLAVNTQSNAGNRGYNNLTKYPKMDFFTANSGELSLELRAKKLDYSKVVPDLMKNLGAKSSVLTLGGSGLMIFSNQMETKVPAFATKVVDKVGAGDSVFAISSLLSYLKAPHEIIGLISNLVAANEISRLGHQIPLSLGDIRKQIKAMLG